MNRAEHLEWAIMLRDMAERYNQDSAACGFGPASALWHLDMAARFRAAARCLEWPAGPGAPPDGETGCSEPGRRTAGIPEPATTDETAPASPRAGR